MAGIAFSDFNALPDVLALDRFELLLSPSGSSNTNQTLAIRCVQLSIPAEQTEPMLVAIQGLQFYYRGRRIYDQQMIAAFVETTDGAVQRSLRTWTQQIVGGERFGENGRDAERRRIIGRISRGQNDRQV